MSKRIMMATSDNMCAVVAEGVQDFMLVYGGYMNSPLLGLWRFRVCAFNCDFSKEYMRFYASLNATSMNINSQYYAFVSQLIGTTCMQLWVT